MPCCSIITCRNTTHKAGSVNRCISYHSFPKDPYITKKWIDATGRKKWFPTKNSKICSEHFHEDTFTGYGKHRRVINTAYPTFDIVIRSNDKKVEIKGQSLSKKPDTPEEGKSDPSKKDDATKKTDTPKKRKLEKNKMSVLQSLPMSKPDDVDPLALKPNRNLSSTTLEAPAPTSGYVNDIDNTIPSTLLWIDAKTEPESLDTHSPSQNNTIKEQLLSEKPRGENTRNVIVINPGLPDINSTPWKALETDYVKRIKSLEKKLERVKKISKRRLQKINALTKRVTRLTTRNSELYKIVLQRLQSEHSEDCD